MPEDKDRSARNQRKQAGMQNSLVYTEKRDKQGKQQSRSSMEPALYSPLLRLPWIRRFNKETGQFRPIAQLYEMKRTHIFYFWPMFGELGVSKAMLCSNQTFYIQIVIFHCQAEKKPKRLVLS